MVKLGKARKEGRKGFTLIELLVGIIVFAILLGAMAFVFVYSLRIASASQVRVRTQEDLRSTLDYMSRLIRRAGIKPVETALEEIGEKSVTFQSDIDGDGQPDRFRLGYDEGTKAILLEKWRRSAGAFTESGVVEVVMDGVKDLTFVYYSSANVETNDPDEISAIGIHLTLYPKPSGTLQDKALAGELSGTTMVYCPNLGIKKS